MATLTSDQKRNTLMHVLSHQMPEFSSILRSGADISNYNRDYFYKYVSGKRATIGIYVNFLWKNLSGPTEATFRYDLFLDRNPNFPILFQTNGFKQSFTYTISQDGPGGILGHQESPEVFYRRFVEKYMENRIKEWNDANPGATRDVEENEYMKIVSKFNSDNQRQFFNAVIVALTKPLPPIYVHAADAVTNGYYSANQLRQAKLAAEIAAEPARGGSQRKTRRHRHRR